MSLPRTVTITEAIRTFPRLLTAVRKGEHVEIVSRGRVVARLAPGGARRDFGCDRGVVQIAEDFDAPLRDFAGPRWPGAGSWPATPWEWSPLDPNS